MDLATLEPIHHGNEKMNIAFYHHDTHKGGILSGTFAAHYHSEYEIVYVHRGSILFYLNGVHQRVNAGEALIINKNVIHGCDSSNDEHASFMCIVFGEQFVFSDSADALYEKYFLPLHLSNKEFPVFIRGDTECNKQLLSVIASLCRSGSMHLSGCELEWRIDLLKLFHIAIANHIFIDGKQYQNKNISAIRTALSYIEKNYTEPISISQLARQTGFSTEYFCRIFKLLAQKTPVEYITSLRLKQAKHLLTHTEDSISSIAGASGFNDVNYFSRCFKKQNGMTPRQYRMRFS